MAIKIHRLPTGLQPSSSSSSCSSELDLGSYSFPNDPTQQLIVIRHRPKIYRTKIDASTAISPLPPSIILFMMFMGSLAAVLLIFGLFFLALHRHRRQQRAKRAKDRDQMTEYQAVPTKEVEASFHLEI